jgi:hypothetical protein
MEGSVSIRHWPVGCKDLEFSRSHEPIPNGDTALHLSSRAQSRDLQFSGPLLVTEKRWKSGGKAVTRYLFPTFSTSPIDPKELRLCGHLKWLPQIYPFRP